MLQKANSIINFLNTKTLKSLNPQKNTFKI